MNTKTSDKSKPGAPVDLAGQRRGLFKVAGLGVLVCFVGLFAGYLLLPRYFNFPEALTDRFVFWARLQIFLLIWVAVGVGAVSRDGVGGPFGARHTVRPVRAWRSGSRSCRTVWSKPCWPAARI